jgi:hypothetical protein
MSTKFEESQYKDWISLVNVNSYNLRCVPDSLKTEEMCKIAVTQTGYALEYVLDSLKTPELCKIAVTQHGRALQFVPDSLKTLELCEIAITNNKEALKYVPENPEFYEFCKIFIIHKKGSDLQYVPEKLRTLELCKLAVTNNKEALYYIPNELKETNFEGYLELCEIAGVINEEQKKIAITHRINKIDPLSFEPLTGNILTLNGVKYNEDSLKLWINTFKHTGIYPSCPLTRLKLIF